jgi:hypothetical protein
VNNDLAFTKPCRKDLCHFLFDKSKFVSPLANFSAIAVSTLS